MKIFFLALALPCFGDAPLNDGFDVVLAVYTGDSLNDLALVAASDQPGLAAEEVIVMVPVAPPLEL